MGIDMYVDTGDSLVFDPVLRYEYAGLDSTSLDTNTEPPGRRERGAAGGAETLGELLVAGYKQPGWWDFTGR